MNARTRTAAVTLAGLAALASLTVACERKPPLSPATPTTTGRDQQVADHSAEVMPFDLTRATHAFDDTSTGLVETVTENAPVDPAQVALIRSHLAMEAQRFAAGNFDDPARIHGDTMPGLTVLRTAAGRLTVAYADVPDGGRITYTSADPAVIDALHRFGMAQSMDHGHH